VLDIRKLIFDFVFLLEFLDSGSEGLSEGQWNVTVFGWHLGFHHCWQFIVDVVKGVVLLGHVWDLVLDHLMSELVHEFLLLELLEHLLGLEGVLHGHPVHLVEGVLVLESVHSGDKGAHVFVGFPLVHHGWLVDALVHDGIVDFRGHDFLSIGGLVLRGEHLLSEDGFEFGGLEVLVSVDGFVFRSHHLLAKDLVQVDTLKDGVLHHFGFVDFVHLVLNWEVHVVDWHNLLINKLDISNGDFLFSGDGVDHLSNSLFLNNSAWEHLDIGQSLGDFLSHVVFVHVQVLGNLLQNVLVVDSMVVSGWEVKSFNPTAHGHGHWDRPFFVVWVSLVFALVGVWVVPLVFDGVKGLELVEVVDSL